MTGSGSLQLQDRSQAFVNRALQTGRQRAGVFRQESAVEGQKLRDINDRVALEPRRARRQQYIARGVG